MFIRVPFASGGTHTAIPIPSQAGGQVSWTDGFTVDYSLDPSAPTAKNVPRAESNELYYILSKEIQQYQIRGFPEFITASDNNGTAYEYGINATVRFVGGWAGTGAVNYYSLADGNTATPADNTKWGLVTYTQVPEPTAVGKEFWGIDLPAGYVWANGQTIGNLTSGATGRANADTQALFIALWNASTQTNLPLQNSSGTVVARGIDAATDFAANRRLPTPDKRNKVSIGKGDMGGTTDVALITVAGCGISGATMFASGGVETISLVGSQNGVHSHSATSASAGTHFHSGTTDSAGSHSHTVTPKRQRTGNTGADTAEVPAITSSTIVNPYFTDVAGAHTHTFNTDNAGAHTHPITVNNDGSGAPHANVQPTIVCNYIIKL